MSPRRRRTTLWVLFALFVVVPLAEIYVLIQVGQVIGAWWTVVLLVLDSLVGSWLIKREGGRAWQALRTALQTGRMPATELADGALVLVGGTLMLSPGFVTDAFGILLILPVTRPLARRLLARLVTRRLLNGSGPWDARRPGPGSGGSVVRGEVVDDGRP
ncbi:MAG: FxsA family protein [Kineosporiaceae bacterium]